MGTLTYRNHFDRRKDTTCREFWDNRFRGYNGKQRKLGRPECPSLGEYMRRIRTGEIAARKLPVGLDGIPDFY